MDEVTRWSIEAAGAAVRARRVSPVELTEAYLARIEAYNGLLNAYVTVTAESALAEARAAEAEIARGVYRGPLHGIPIALKDLYWTRGVRTAAGSKIIGDFVPNDDGTVTASLRAAGAVLLGKTNTHELAYGVTTNNPHFGPTRNPWDPARIPGGSSGGSAAAVAAGMAAMAMGTDTGGSIRIPASLCGVVGLKPTHGRVSTAGIVPLAWSLDHAGPLAKSVADAAIVLNVIAGADDADPLTPPVPVADYTRALGAGVRGLRLGVPRAFFAECDAEVLGAVASALHLYRDLGAVVVDVTLPPVQPARDAVADLLLAEARWLHRDALRDRPEDFGADVHARLTRRTDLTAEELVSTRRVQHAFTVGVTEVLTTCAALLLPTTRIPAPDIAGQTITVNGAPVFAPTLLLPNTNPFNLTGMPALSVPCGFTAGGLPIGLQIVGRRWDEVTVLRVGAAYERATQWHRRVPSLSVGGDSEYI